MRSVGSHSISGKEKEGKREKTGYLRAIPVRLVVPDIVYNRQDDVAK